MFASLSSSVIALRVRIVLFFPNDNAGHSEALGLRDGNVFAFPHNWELELKIRRIFGPKDLFSNY